MTADTLDVHALLTHDYWGTPLRHPLSHRSWRPLTTLTFWLSHRHFGLSARHFHLVNILLHGLNSALVFLLAARVCPDGVARLAALAAGLLFALHPMHAEAVSNITNRGELLSLALQLLAVLAYRRACCARRPAASLAWLLPAFACALLAVLSKESGLMCIPVAVACDLLDGNLLGFLAGLLRVDPHRAASKSNSKQPDQAPNTPALWTPLRMLRTLLAGLFCAGFMAVRLYIQGEAPEWHGTTNPAAEAGASFFSRFFTIAYMDWTHLRLLLLPTTFCPDWRNTIHLITSTADPAFATAVAFLIALVALALGLLRLHSRSGLAASTPAATAAAWTVLPFLPAANIFFYVGFAIAERVTYAPSVGFCLGLGLLVSWLAKRFR